MSDREIFAKTLFAEARGESREGWEWVAWAIKNRAAKNLDRWGGSSIGDVCKKSWQFECWTGVSDITIPAHERGVYEEIRRFTDRIYDSPLSKDPTGGATHYNNPDKEGFRDWTKGVTWLRKIGNHQFYREEC